MIASQVDPVAADIAMLRGGIETSRIVRNNVVGLSVRQTVYAIPAAVVIDHCIPGLQVMPGAQIYGIGAVHNLIQRKGFCNFSHLCTDDDAIGCDYRPTAA